MKNIKDEVLKKMKIENDQSYLVNTSHVEKVIDLTQQKMIEQFKEVIDKRINVLKGYNYNTKGANAEFYTHNIIRIKALEELKTEVSNG
jgi:hypothetical protein